MAWLAGQGIVNIDRQLPTDPRSACARAVTRQPRMTTAAGEIVTGMRTGRRRQPLTGTSRSPIRMTIAGVCRRTLSETRIGRAPTRTAVSRIDRRTLSPARIDWTATRTGRTIGGMAGIITRMAAAKARIDRTRSLNWRN